MYGSPFYHEPQRRNVEELRSNNSLEMWLKVGQRLAHPLYVYKIEITKIMAFEEETSYRLSHRVLAVDRKVANF
ncbi:hypothetical protein [Bacillus cereus]|uniref:hypothetical protein n=1 Tax=Bacillus cereus TaxID=1396 RepID=UPI003EE3CFAD